jgi:hypothetical protein
VCSVANCGDCKYNANGDGTCEGNITNLDIDFACDVVDCGIFGQQKELCCFNGACARVCTGAVCHL